MERNYIFSDISEDKYVVSMPWPVICSQQQFAERASLLLRSILRQLSESLMRKSLLI